jgi:Tol biopolymer transport system component
MLRLLRLSTKEGSMSHVRLKLFVAALVVAVAAGLAVAVAPSHATYHGQNGRIAFRRYFDDAHHLSAIFTVNADGSGQTRITRPPKGFVDDQPDWSPDGKLIAFTRCVIDHLCSVYLVHADGTGLKRVSPPCPGNLDPPRCEDDANVTFLPDGSHVAYTRSSGNVQKDQIQHSAIVVSDLTGTHRRVLLQSGDYQGDYNFAYFSPDGKRFVYEHVNSSLARPAGHHALFVGSANGSDVHRNPPWSHVAADNPAWSPDGNWILFRTHEDADTNSNIAIVHPDGSGFRQLTHFEGKVNMRSATFSPDGQSVVFASDLAKGGNPAVYTMNLDGTNVQRVTHVKVWDSAVDWGTGQ